jgi:pimeloyl-ACP methyl ester carboxylesterase
MTELAQAPVRGVAAGVPYLALPPPPEVPEPGLVVGWHLMDPPRTEAAMAAALPMAGIPAWRVYFGLPRHGRRSLPGGPDALMRLGYEDVVLRVDGPVAEEALAEFPAALAAVRDRLGLDDRPIGLFGGSSGAAIAQLVLLETDVRATAVALVSPLVQLTSKIEAVGRRLNVTYAWHDAARAIADRLDFVARAGEIVGTDPQPAVLLVVGEQEDPAFRLSAELLWARLSSSYRRPERVSLVTVPGMGHALAGEPGDEPAPQNHDARRVNAAMTAWFDRYLG